MGLIIIIAASITIIILIVISLTKVKEDPNKGKCTECKFNLGESCGVGSFYAEKGISGICFGGELWEKLNDKK